VKIALLDPGLHAVAGHHYDLDRRLGDALVRLGHEVVIHGHRRLDAGLMARSAAAGLPMHATFQYGPYASPPPSPPGRSAYREMALETARNLADVAEADLWLWPTLSPYQLAAAMAASFAGRQIGGAWWLPGCFHPEGHACWVESVRALADAGSRIRLGAYDELLCEAYRSLAPDGPMARLPCPHDGAPNARPPGVLGRIGFFGHQRPARGVEILPDLIRALLAQGYEVVVHDSGGSIRGKDGHPRLTLLGYLDDFAAELARCDLVVWPSRREAYTHCMSGVVSEAIASGVPVVVPAGCIPARIVARQGAGIEYHTHTSSAILAALAEAARDFAGLSARARAAADAWHAQNGSERLAEWIDLQLRNWN